LRGPHKIAKKLSPMFVKYPHYLNPHSLKGETRRTKGMKPLSLLPLAKSK